MTTHSSIFAGEFHGQRSLTSYSLWIRQEVDTTERLTHTYTKPPHKQMFYFYNGAEKSAFTISEQSKKRPLSIPTTCTHCNCDIKHIRSASWRTDMVAKEEGVREGGLELEISRYKLLYTSWINNKVLLYSTGNYIQYAVINQNGKEYKKEFLLCV